MEVKVNDLLKIKSINHLIYTTPPPNWVEKSLTKAPFVVVRRSESKENIIPVGIRGSIRSERFPAFMKIDNIDEKITPEEVVLQKSELIDGKTNLSATLDELIEQMNKKDLVWGLGGSVAFELVSGVSTVNKASDIDLIIRYTPRLTVSYCKELIQELDKYPINIDVQVETSEGSFSLVEFVHSEGKPILFKTLDGPKLIKV